MSKINWNPYYAEFAKASEILMKNKKDCENFPNIEEGNSEQKQKAIDQLLEMVYGAEVDYSTLNKAEQQVVLDDVAKAMDDARKDLEDGL